jgi:hypothetical protein
VTRFSLCWLRDGAIDLALGYRRLVGGFLLIQILLQQSRAIAYV